LSYDFLGFIGEDEALATPSLVCQGGGWIDIGWVARDRFKV
jgi:hypothetical protein